MGEGLQPFVVLIFGKGDDSCEIFPLVPGFRKQFIYRFTISVVSPIPRYGVNGELIGVYSVFMIFEVGNPPNYLSYVVLFDLDLREEDVLIHLAILCIWNKAENSAPRIMRIPAHTNANFNTTGTSIPVFSVLSRDLRFVLSALVATL